MREWIIDFFYIIFIFLENFIYFNVVAMEATEVFTINFFRVWKYVLMQKLVNGLGYCFTLFGLSVKLCC